MKLYDRDYSKDLTESEKEEYELILNEEKEGKIIGKKNLYFKYPAAIRHYQTLFPNNHIDLIDWKRSGNMNKFTEEFSNIVHSNNSSEREILKFINHKPAHYIIGSLLTYKDFGHHETYIFPEFSIGSGTYYADYLIVGKNSGGYEFLFVELEAPNKSTTLKNGHYGQATRSGINQIRDWKYEIEANFHSIAKEFENMSNNAEKLPEEFKRYDSTRIHYMIITGLRDDYNDVTYRDRREAAKNNGIDMYHYDNLIDLAKGLEDKNTF